MSVGCHGDRVSMQNYRSVDAAVGRAVMRDVGGWGHVISC